MEVIIGAASSVLEKILGNTIGLIGRHLGYLIYYRANKKNLTNQVEELDEKMRSVQYHAQAAQSNLEKLEKCVIGWKNDAEEKIRKANNVMGDGGHENAKCSCNGSIPNLMSRYKLSKKAKLMAEDIEAHIGKSDNFGIGKFSHRRQFHTSFENKDFEAFVSRTKTLEEIMEALKDPDLKMIGVCGMGGVGKTTLVKEVARQAKEKECFSKVAMVTVSEEYNPKNIQQEIAEELGLKLEAEILSSRATKLQDRLKQEEKILIILDDIWSEFDLLEVGIYFEADNQKGCKILLVSRDRNVFCKKMSVGNIIEVGVLSDSEARGLFNKFVMDKDRTKLWMKTSSEIMVALKDPDLSMIGVYGMGGAGRTTLVEEVAHEAKEEECFSKVVMVNASQEVNPKDIQQEIAEKLGLKLKGETLSRRANKLRRRLRQEENILIILDDIWRELNLLEVGIYFEAGVQKGCKILLVSGDQRSLKDVRKIIEVKVLVDSEAMGLFNKFVGDKADNSDFEELANQVVGECGGLPVAIVTIACSLKNKDILFWKDFLSRLKSSRGMEGEVYSRIKISYDFLESEEEKKLLLLCSLHGEDANVRVNDLMFYGIGLDLFQGVHTMEKARRRAQSLVNKLKGRCLLLDGDYEGRVKMHDVIRDVMISIAKKDEHMRCLTKVADLEKCLQKEDFRDLEEYSKAIVLLGPHFNNQLLPCLVCPKLQLLLAFDRYSYLSLGSIPDDFFKEAQQLKALSFNCKPLQSLPQSFCTLRHLRALRLRLGEKADLTLIGELRNLIALDLSRSTFSQLPDHIGNLTRLRSLNLSGCKSLRVIQPNVISSLVRLEELYMDDVNIDWEVEGRVGEGRNASLMEVKNLRNLTTLHLNVRDADVLPKDMFSENLQHYRIMIGSFPGDTRRFTGSRLLYLNLRESSQLHQYGIQKLTKKSEGMHLEGFHGDNIVYELDIYSFPQLRALYVSNCPNLKYLFTVAMAGRLEQLETLKIRRCPDMEGVVVTNEHGEGRLEKILFPKLKSLELEDLPNLKRFCTGDCIECPSSNEEEVEGPFFNEKVSFPILEDLRLSTMNLKILWADQLSITSFGMPNLKRLYVFSCDSLSHLFSLDVARSLLQLEELQLENCKDTEEVLVTKEPIEEETPQKILFPKLKNLELRNVENIRRFCVGCCIEFPSLTNMKILGGNPAMITDSCNGASGELMGFQARQPFFNGKVAFPKLEELEVQGLNSVNSLFSFAVAKSLITLKKLEVWGGSRMEEIVQVNEQGRLDKISFPKLESIKLLGLLNLKRFYEKSEELMGSEAKQPLFNGTVAFPKLEALDVFRLDSVNSLFSFDVANSLEALKSLKVSWCSLMEEIVQVNEQGEEGRLDKISFPKLESIYFHVLPNLKRFYGGACIELSSLLKSGITTDKETEEIMDRVVLGPNLEELRTSSSVRPLKRLKKLMLFRLSMLTHLYEDSEDSENSSLESLKFLRIQECSRLKSPLLSSTTSLQNLMALVVSECSAMINLLALSTAKTLVHLRLMSITECKQMTEIIVDEIVDDEIVFSKLEILELSDLPSLRSFHSAGNSVMRFPNLVMLVVSQCPEMRRFSFGTIDAPKLDSISEIEKRKYRWEYSLLDEDRFNYGMSHLPKPQQKLWEGDINKTLEKLWEEDDYSLAMQRLFTDT